MSTQIPDDELAKMELEAMGEIHRVLQPFDVASRERILGWVQKRLVSDPLAMLAGETGAALQAHFEELKAQAAKIGVTDTQLVHAYSALREREGIAPIEVREQIERAEEQEWARTHPVKDPSGSKP